MAPEYLIRSSDDPIQLGPQADVYGLGATLFRLLSGKPPRDSDVDLLNLANGGSDSPSPPLDAVEVACPASLKAVVEKAIAVDTTVRYKTVADFRTDLNNVLAGRPTVARRPSQLRRLLMLIDRRRRTTLAICAVIAILAVAGWLAIDGTRAKLGTARLAQAVSQELDEHFGQIDGDEDFASTVKENFRARLQRQQDLILAATNDQKVHYHGAVGRFILGEYLQDIGQNSEAREQFLIAEAGFRRLHSAGYGPDETQFDLFHCSFRLYGLALAMKDRGEMDRRLERATKLITGLVERSPDDPVLLDCQAQMGLYQGDARLRDGQNAAAVAVLVSALEAAKKAERLSGSQGKYVPKIGACTQYLGRAAAEAGNYADAEKLYAEALRLAIPDGRDESDLQRLRIELQIRGSRCIARIAASRFEVAQADIAEIRKIGAACDRLNPGSAFHRKILATADEYEALIAEARAGGE